MLRLLAFLVLLLSTGPVAQDAVLVAPRCPDPPPSVDGRLGEWQASRWGRVIETRQHATFGAEHWKGAGDLSARSLVQLGRCQPLPGCGCARRCGGTVASRWCSLSGRSYRAVRAHRPEPASRAVHRGRLAVRFLPGNFSSTGDRLADIAPEGSSSGRPTPRSRDARRRAAHRGGLHLGSLYPSRCARCEAGGGAGARRGGGHLG